MSEATLKTTLKIYGVAASPGIAIGIARVLKKNKIVSTGILLNNESDIKNEIEKFDNAIHSSVNEIERIKNNENLNSNQESQEILETHIELLTDPQLKIDVYNEINVNRKNAIDAVIEIIHNIVQVFNKLDNEYLKARAADVQDIGNRILKNLGTANNNEHHFLPNTIIIAEDISPTEVLNIDLKEVIGFVTQAGGKTSHTAILAKSKNIPAVLGCGDPVNIIEEHDLIIVDAANGIIIVNPSDDCIEEYKIKKTDFDEKREFLNSLKQTPAQTTDGIKIELLTNISSTEDLEESLDYGAEGVGLFRTEWLYMNSKTFPTEEEQFEYYRKVALRSKDKPITIRTIDIGGDKPLDYFQLPKEENPFLGYRGIRICLDRKDIFTTQLKAILRASVFGRFKIMFPMISNVHELRLAKEILNDTKDELKENDIEFDLSIPVGIMIEVPSAALMADILAKEVDFFSIGTNDLCQYILAVDRGNETIKELYNPFDPAVLRLISNVISQADQNNISVSICGEMASDPNATRLLMGMGLKEFSMSPSSIPIIKNIILNTSYSQANEVWSNVQRMDNGKSIVNYLQELQ
ncbi:MAG: phosphoenolpyruvate--protein phosphotransferase [Saprospiraceae bacterium]